jgi:EamA domain-containing membrane protein RarD
MICQSRGWHCRSFVIVAIIVVLWHCIYGRLRKYTRNRLSVAGGFLLSCGIVTVCYEGICSSCAPTAHLPSDVRVITGKM